MESRSRFRATFSRGGQHAAPTQPAQHQETAATHHQTAHHQPAAAHHPKPKKLGFFYGRKWLIAVVALVVLAFAGLTYGYIHTKNQLNAAKNPAAAGKTEADKIIAVVGKTIQLPSGETPTVATVNDVSKLKNQAFFKNAQNGDKVLVYTRAGQAVLYRPSTQKVILFSYVNAGNNQ